MNEISPKEAHDLEFTGERYQPEIAGQIAFEHLHRYYAVRSLARNLRVLDIACGEGYGSSILAATASSVVGADISDEAVRHASSQYVRDNVRFVQASAADLPFANDSFDLVVSFETIEHHDQHEEMLAEIKRVLGPQGLLVISSPNKQHYTIDTGYENPFHVKELFKDEFLALVGKHFSHVKSYGQRVVYGSLLIEDSADIHFETLRLDSESLAESKEIGHQVGLGRPAYDLIVAGDVTADMPEISSSLFEMPVHQMDAARFYGVHLPERVSGADRRIAELGNEISAAPMSLSEARIQFEALHEGMRGLAGKQDTIASAAASQLGDALGVWAAHLNQAVGGAVDGLTSRLLVQPVSLLNESLHRIEAIDDAIRSFSDRQLAAEKALGELEGLQTVLKDTLQSLEAKRSRREQELQSALDAATIRSNDLEQRLEGANSRLEHSEQALVDVLNSRSWRSTVLLRKISSLVRGNAR